MDINTERVKQLTMNKVKESKHTSYPTKALKFCASLGAFIIASSVTTYTFAGPETRGFIQERLGLEIGEVLLVGESISSKDYIFTVIDFVYDGNQGTMTYGVTAKSNKAKETFYTDRLFEKVGHISMAGSTGQLDIDGEEYTQFFTQTFTHNVDEKRDCLIFSFEDIKNMINIPLTPTIETAQIAIDVPSHSNYGTSYHKLVYSKLGFTLVGTEQNDAVSPQNITIDFVLKNGETINFVNHIDHDYSQYMPTDFSGSEDFDWKLQMIDGEKKLVKYATNSVSLVSDEKNIINEVNVEWLAGSSLSGYNNGNYMRESKFSFTKSFDWDNVAKIIINGTEIEL
ncbi:MAG: hypothetical protein ATN35_13025 [Epulopiscium sp. Nele67-Bin004]|nr:MAG: hypothetical protein ATN35_13025 [Epulopiscium sp. Nele67-Bin004]